MGHYTGHAFHLRFKADAPQGIIDHIRKVAYIEIDTPLTDAPLAVAAGTALVESHDAVKEMLSDITYLMCGSSEYMKTWYGIRVLTQDDQGRWCLQTKGSSKNTERESVANFLISLLPYLDVQEGDILFRSIYETGHTESIFYFTEGGIKYGEYLGYWYYDEMADDEHPYGDTVDFNWNPPLNFDRLQRLVALKKAWHKQSGHSNESWDVEKANGSLDSFSPEEVKHWSRWTQGEKDPMFNHLMCPEVAPVSTIMIDSFSSINAGTPVRSDIKAHWGVPKVGDIVVRGDNRFNVTHIVDYPTLLPNPGMGRYYSESFNFKPALDALGRLWDFGYRSHIGMARYYEAIKHSDGEVTAPGSARMRPARRKFLDKLARYKAQVE